MQYIIDLEKKYRNVIILDSIEWWHGANIQYDPAVDLVLTYDFGLKHKISTMGGDVFYIDSLLDSETMQINNFLVYDFFQKWHLNAEGKDIFVYKEVPFGFSLRLDIWNDFTFYARLRSCLQILKTMHFKSIFLGSENTTILSILETLEITFNIVTKNSTNTQSSYYFPIAKWMDEQLRAKGLRGFLYLTREVITFLYGKFMIFLNQTILKNNYKKVIFIQEYFPTKKIISVLRKDPNLRIILTNFSRGTNFLTHFSENLIPIGISKKKYTNDVQNLIHKLNLYKHNKLVLHNGEDISKEVYSIIEKRLQTSLNKTLCTLDSVIHFVNKNKLHLEILIANIGHTATLLDCVCKHKGIPSYLIINGLLTRSHQDESKYATFINSYSISIRDNYFYGMNNIVCLGDPRMDAYFGSSKKIINRKNPVITIGASSFNNVDLNSYVAVEFDFLYDILTAFKMIITKGFNLQLVLKIRPSSYAHQYKNFIEEFFPSLNLTIISNQPMKTVFEKTDFYISTFSQTLFEASALGIPCLYYKKDNEIMHPPFDKKSELVTATNITDLIQAFFDFLADDTRYKAFLDHTVLEKYIGPLDGNNTQRNIDYVYELLEKENLS